MKVLKVWFSDFWHGFDVQNNFIVQSLSKRYVIQLSEIPDILFFSCFGHDHVRFTSKKVYFIGENIRPNFFLADFTISFDYNTYNKRNIRWPLYNLYFDPKTDPVQSKPTKFCCMVVSNPRNKLREKVFRMLSAYKTVDSGGRWLNNVGGAVSDKNQFLMDYKFCLCFENTYHDGYTTEKLLEAKLFGCIPIYWGNRRVGDDFNKKAFISLHDYSSISEMIYDIARIDADDNLFNTIRSEPLLNNNEYTIYSNKAIFNAWLYSVVESENNYFFHNKLLARIFYLTSDFSKKIENKLEMKKYGISFLYNYDIARLKAKIVKRIQSLIKGKA